ncbi:MAG: hypothetical protein U0641_15285 [Anaerolineae bacterium]
MAILTCAIPSFALGWLARSDAALLTRPVAVLGAGGRVVDASASARAAGVAVGQTVRQAQVACADLLVREVDVRDCAREFEAVLGVLEGFSDRVEPAGLGQAFVDAPGVKADDAADVCREVGRQVRNEVGATLQPAIGCDSGKFTAHAAASHTAPGRIRVVMGADETPFLRPLPVGLLPLPLESQTRLGYLGIRRLGQYADLPPKAVLQQFGLSGKLAQSWARGEDRRPVAPRSGRPQVTMSAQFDPPLDTLGPLLGAALRLLEEPTVGLQTRLQGAQAMTAALEFTHGPPRVARWALTAPTAERGRLGQLLVARWEGGRWDGGVTGLTLTLGEIGDLLGHQMALWDAGEAQAGRQGQVREMVSALRLRYGGEGLLRARVTALGALRVEGRVQWGEWAS